jgi:hypothetical protein
MWFSPMMSKVKNLFQVPTAIPAGKVLVHNLISHHRNAVPGTNGFRAWFDTPHFDYVLCSCGWAPHLRIHYCEEETKEDMGQSRQRLRPLRF